MASVIWFSAAALRLSWPPPQSHKTLNLATPNPVRLQYRFSNRYHVKPQLSPCWPKLFIISCSYTPTPATDRLISAASYFLPFFNGIQYGRFLFTQYPSLAVPFRPIFPLLSLYSSIPYASFVSFFALYLGVVRNSNFSRYVRFNALQAVVLDVLLALPLLVQRIFNPGHAGLGFKLMVMGHDAIFVFIVFCFVYSLVCTVLGKTPYLPYVADAAARQL